MVYYTHYVLHLYRVKFQQIRYYNYFQFILTLPELYDNQAQ